jgi:ribosomal protein L31E
MRICPECSTTFTPASPRQHFCRPACAHSRRQRKYRQTRKGVTTPSTGRIDQSTTDSQEAKAALTAFYEAALRKLRSTDQRKLAALTRSFENRLAAAHEQLNDSARASSRAASKAEELEIAVALLRKDKAEFTFRERQAMKDLQQVAARCMALHEETNTRLDPRTAEIFARRGWNTEMGRS